MPSRSEIALGQGTRASPELLQYPYAMHTFPRLLVPLFLLAACRETKVELEDDTGQGHDADGETDTDTDTDADTDTDTDTDADTGPLPDLSEYLDPDASACVTLHGTPRAGAKGYLLADLHGSATEGWEGQLRWVLYANDTWKEQGGSDCEVTWNTTGTAGAVTYCEACDFGLTMAGFVSRAETTCPESVYFNYQSFTSNYDIRLDEDGSAEWYWYYASPSASGYWTGADVTDLNFLSPAACVWF